MYTRGAGTEGQDVSHLLSVIRLPELPRGNWAIRGEAIISRESFTKWQGKRKNPRSMTAGLINTDIPNLNREMAEDIDFVAFEVIQPHLTPSNGYQWLEDHHFTTVHHHKCKTLSANRLTKLLHQRREESAYDIDGIVVYQDRLNPYPEEGNPEHAFAFKGVTEIKSTTIKQIKWNPSKDGLLVPTIHVRPVTLARTTVSQVTGIHARNVVQNGLGVGAKIQLIKSGEIIPRVIAVLRRAEPTLPDEGVEWDKNEVNLILSDPDSNSDVQIVRLTKFVQDIGVVGLSKGIIARLYHEGYQTIHQLLSIHPKDLARLEGFGERSATKIVKAMETALEELDLLTLMIASNLLGRSMNKKRLGAVLDSYPEIVEEYSPRRHARWEARISDLPGFGPKNTQVFLDNLPVFQQFYHQFIREHPVRAHEGIQECGDQFAGMSIVFTGFRNAKMEEYIKSHGGVIKGDVSKNTSLLIWDKSKGGKYKRAVELGIEIVSKTDFLREYDIE